MTFPDWMGETPRQNSPWPNSEHIELAWGFEVAGLSVPELARKHGRTIGAIENKLFQLCGYESPACKASRLITKGYRKTSNKYCLASRIDRADWIEVLANQMNRAVADYFDPQGNLSAQWADYYRRCLSEDTIRVDQEVLKFIPSSNDDNTGFVQ